MRSIAIDNQTQSPFSHWPGARLLLVDDEPFDLDDLTLCLRDEGFHVHTATSVDDALRQLRRRRYDVLITDIRMEHSSRFTLQADAGGRHSGLMLARKVRALYPGIRILGVSSVEQDRRVTDWFDQQPSATFLSKPGGRYPRVLVRAVRRLLGREPDTKIFIVHGRDSRALAQLTRYVEKKLGLGKPITIRDQHSRGRTIIEKFEECGADADIVFVLFTPDDVGYLATEPDTATRRVRQNVIFELGYFMGFMRRKSGRVIVLRTAAVEMLSDLAGIVYIDISRGIAAADAEIRREIEALG